MALEESGLNHGAYHRRYANHGKFIEKFGRRDTSVVSKNNNSCHVQIDSIALFPDILEAIDRLRLPTVLQEAVTVVQFGSSNGKISVDNVVAILQRLKEKFVLLFVNDIALNREERPSIGKITIPLDGGLRIGGLSFSGNVEGGETNLLIFASNG
ncbi:hypothetical protein R1flu_010358 [Riccia fluitans]|uniref:Uncharacterized protein n=1 Tax=Riccia fluitans TaxID=41844 RepID=A0ABD1Z4R6_9MARC